MDEKHIYNELLKITQKHEYTNEQLAKKIVANSCYPYEEPIKNPHSNTIFWLQEFKDNPDILVVDYPQK